MRGIVSKRTDRELVDMLAHTDIYHPTVLAGVKEELFRRDSPVLKTIYESMPLAQLQIIVTNPTGYPAAEVDMALSEIKRRLGTA